MASIIFSSQSQQGTEIPAKTTIEGIANQILGAANPQATFDKIVSSNPDAKTAMDICQQYGNGDPKTAFFNYARQKGKNALAQTILNRFGLS